MSKPLEPTEEQEAAIRDHLESLGVRWNGPADNGDAGRVFALIRDMVLEAAARELAAMPLGATRMGCIRRIHALKGTTA